jgi:hypothetical protein
MTQVSHPVRLVVPVSLYKIPSQLHDVLRNYKDGRDARIRDGFQLQIAAPLPRFIERHGDCIRSEAGDWDVIATIPSSSGRAGPHPLETTLGRSPYLAQQTESLLSSGSTPIAHNRASDTGYSVTTDVEDRRVLLLDDTFTSGARGQSAASALQLARARIVAMVPVGRVISPDFSPETQALWDKASAPLFDFDRCCLEQ